MSQAPEDGSRQSFYTLTPERILAAVESTGDAASGPRRTTGYVLSLHSLENRVYEIELADASGEPAARVVAKFYRPSRWSEAAIRAEHAFLAELVEVEVPAVAPLALDDHGETLLELEGSGGAPIYFALFAKVRGRATEEPDDERLAILGRLLARLHNVGATRVAPERGQLDPLSYGRRSLEILDAAPLEPSAGRRAHRAAALRLLDQLEPIYARLAPQGSQIRVHGDCHHGNLLWDARGPFFLDFDDFTMAPPAQDLWLVAPGRDADALARRDLLVEAYEEMRPFDRRTLALVEPLRALRILRYAGWIAARWDDPAFQRAFPDFRDEAFWQKEAAILVEQLNAIANAQP